MFFKNIFENYFWKKWKKADFQMGKVVERPWFIRLFQRFEFFLKKVKKVVDKLVWFWYINWAAETTQKNVSPSGGIGRRTGLKILRGNTRTGSIPVSGSFIKTLYAQIAQLVEQWTENPRVTGSIPVLGTICASGSVVEHRLAKARVASSNLVSRFLFQQNALSYYWAIAKR